MLLVNYNIFLEFEAKRTTPTLLTIEPIYISLPWSQNLVNHYLLVLVNSMFL